jgi:hypothetical protein
MSHPHRLTVADFDGERSIHWTHPHTKGCAAAHANHPDVRAALTALNGIQLADTSDFFGFGGNSGATGVLVQPGDDGQVVIYWYERGNHRRADGTPFTAELKVVAAKLRAAGWEVGPQFKVRLTARRPAETAQPTAATPQPAPLHADQEVEFSDGSGNTLTGVITLVWNKPAVDPYVTVVTSFEDRPRKFVRMSSRVQRTGRGRVDSTPDRIKTTK